MLRSSSLSALGCLAAALAIVTHTPDARACGGGMFYGPTEQQTVSVDGHAVVVSISKTRTVLWDRITYTGAPQDFAWIMPVKPGATLAAASPAWIEALVGGTAPTVISPEVFCDDGGGSSSGGCCGATALSGGDGNFGGRGVETDGVTVLHREVVGPYDTVTIASDTPGAIGKWLGENGYAIPAGMQPILDDYAGKGMEFLAAKLSPDKGVQDMTPLRVTMEGGLTTFPMRMLTAGAHDRVPITLVVLAEGRYEAKGFAGATIDPATLTWDFAAHTSDYAAQRTAALAGKGGATWLTSFASSTGLFEGEPALEDLIDVSQGFSLSSSESAGTLVDLYYQRAHKNAEVSTSCPLAEQLGPIIEDNGEVVELCTDTTMPCSKLMPGQIDAASFQCDTLTDLSTAMVGMHPKDVWVTRLEAELPVASLANDLTLTPAAGQAPLGHVVRAEKYSGSPCGDASQALRTPERQAPRRAAAPVAVLLLGLVLSITRKASRRPR